MRVFLTVFVLCSFLSVVKGQTTYYFVGNAVNSSDDLNDLLNWNDALDGSGNSPADYSSPNQIFRVPAGEVAITTAAISISGTGSKMYIENTGSVTINASHTPLFLLDMENGADIILNTTYAGITFGTVNVGSNFTLNLGLLNQSLAYGNLILQGTSQTTTIGTANGGVLNVNGNLFIQGTRTFNGIGGPSAGSRTINVGGDLIIRGSGVFNGNNATVVTASCTTNITGSLRVESGTARLQGATSPGVSIINVGADLNLSGGTFIGTSNSTSNVITISRDFILSGTAIFRGCDGSSASGSPLFRVGSFIDFQGTGYTFSGRANSATGTPRIVLFGVGLKTIDVDNGFNDANIRWTFEDGQYTINNSLTFLDSVSILNALLNLGSTVQTLQGHVRLTGLGTVNMNFDGRLDFTGTVSRNITGVLSTRNVRINKTGGSSISLSSASSDSVLISGELRIIAGTLNTNGRLNLISNGRIIDEASTVTPEGSVIGNVRILRQGNSTVGTPTRWNHISSPVRSADAPFSVLQFGGFIGRRYNETNTSTNINTGWTNVTAGNLNVAQGYATARPGMITHFGLVNNGNQSISVTNTSSGVSASDGWNLIGNPYPSAISSTSFIAGNVGKFQANTIYVWNTSTLDYEERSNLDPDFTIPSGQGFFIKANSANTINFDNTMRLANNSALLKTANTQIKRLYLSLVNPDSISDRTLIAAHPVATDLIDIDFDAVKLWGSSQVQLASMVGNNDYMAIQAVAPINSSKVVPLMYNAVTPGQHRFINPDLSEFNNVDVVLEDTLLNIMHNFKTAGDYVFNQASTVYGSTRFRLHFMPTIVASTEVITPNGPKPYLFTLKPKVLMIDFSGSDRSGALVKVFDMQGRQHKIFEVIDQKERLELPLTDLSSGAYIITLQDSTGVYTFKTILE
jgi:hypothetical protein